MVADQAREKYALIRHLRGIRGPIKLEIGPTNVLTLVEWTQRSALPIKQKKSSFTEY